MIVDSSPKPHEKTRKRDVAIAGACGLTAKIGASHILNSFYKTYYSKVIMNQPDIFNEEEKYFEHLKKHANTIANYFGKNSDIKRMSEDINNTKNDKKEMLKTAQKIYMSNGCKETNYYTSGFFNILNNAYNVNIKDEQLANIINDSIKKNQLNENERDILKPFLDDFSTRKAVFVDSYLSELQCFEALKRLSQNVLINPKLVNLADQMMQEKNLSSKGVSRIFGTQEYYEEQKTLIIEYINKQEEKKLLKVQDSSNIITKKLKTIAIKINALNRRNNIRRTYNQLISGTNAFYNSSLKKAFLPLFSQKKDAIFHELGHAVNSTKSKSLEKALTYAKHKLPKPIIATTVLSSVFLKKQDKNEEKNIITKTREFAKNNICSIVAVATAPTIIEEGIASIHAVNFLKGKISSAEMKHIKLNSFTSWSTYVIGTAITALSAKFAIYISDKVQESKQK